jgi:hypothetical protein
MHVQLIWSLSTANGAGPFISQGSTAQGSTLSWNSLYGLQSFLSAYVSGCLGQSGKLPPPVNLRTSHDSKIGLATPAHPTRPYSGKPSPPQ